MFTITADTILPCTVTGSWPRPRWFDMSMWGKPLDTCMMDVRFREKFQDALATVLSDQERAGLDILTHGDLHCDDDRTARLHLGARLPQPQRVRKGAALGTLGRRGVFGAAAAVTAALRQPERLDKGPLTGQAIHPRLTGGYKE